MTGLAQQLQLGEKETNKKKSTKKNHTTKQNSILNKCRVMVLLRSAAIRQQLEKKIMSDKKPNILSGACLLTDFLGVYRLGMG